MGGWTKKIEYDTDQGEDVNREGVLKYLSVSDCYEWTSENNKTIGFENGELEAIVDAYSEKDGRYELGDLYLRIKKLKEEIDIIYKTTKALYLPA